MTSQGGDRNISEDGILEGAINHVTLVLHLVRDRRVSFFLKALFILSSVIYVISPIDLFPDVLAPVLGPFAPLVFSDDVLFVLLASKVFEKLCPEDVVQHYRM